MTPRNQIQFTICLNNICLQLMASIYSLMYNLSFQYLFSRELKAAVFFVFYFFFSFSHWLSAWLCIFYCVTVVSCKNCFITGLKMRLSVVVPKLLLVTALGCFSITVPSFWYLNVTSNLDVSRNLTTTNTNAQVMYHDNNPYRVVTYVFGSILPTVICIICLIITVTSLLGHVWKLKCTMSSLRDSHDEVHYKACKTMLLLGNVFLFLFVVQIISASSNTSSINVPRLIMLCSCQIYPTELAIILILGCSKLKRALFRIARCMK
ncbi:taste receptor type 2 member 40-like [Bombina bombina]|uniref:taste receptor type 2 member 40-like n=1 Tax=Bombina bombina TaxID=8345 RepID=UPI00235ADD8A|nr:taste receptor type 2 member 40-like [Bombina bombina]